MNKLIVSLGLMTILTGCGEPAKELATDTAAQQKPADELEPIVKLNSSIPAMPKTPQTAVAPDEKVGGVKTEKDLEAALMTPTNQSVISNNGKSSTVVPDEGKVG